MICQHCQVAVYGYSQIYLPGERRLTCKPCKQRIAKEWRVAHKKPPAEKKIACKAGHPFTPENIYPNERGLRVCRPCNRRRGQEWYQKAKLYEKICEKPNLLES